jgi:hypothetical protein
MSSQTFSRAFLQAQATPEAHKQNYIENSIIRNFINELLPAANAGKTQYIYTHNPAPHARKCVTYGSPLPPPPPTITNEDLVTAFKLKFPDCDVSYQEIWVEVNPTNRVLKKGIVIDWS